MIEHQPEQQRFSHGNQQALAVLEYQLHPPKVHFTSTYVPDSMRGQGIAEKLVRTGLAWAREQNYEITTSCWYVDKFLAREKSQ
ncbi:GNAT family N-acetyltransferase [Nitrincola schmidtii]|uniref:GNAT family N-acetyltransferase n=1 Tax=Nitrincola schmidtii TaxID=1730894 RepID=UPI00124F1583|nr:GNAT family N-acetyltransferase [Nitrincola schmidtii]